MALTRADMRNLVISNTNRSDKVTVINAALAFGYREIQQLEEFRAGEIEETKTLANNAQSLTLDNVVGQVSLVRLILANDSQKICIKDRRWVQSRFPSLENTRTGRPEICYTDERVVYFVGLANQDYTITVNYFPAYELTADSDVLFDNALENALIAWATAYTFDSIQMFDAGAQWMRKYEIALRKAASGDRQTHSERVVQGHGSVPASVADYRDPFAGLPGGSNG